MLKEAVKPVVLEKINIENFELQKSYVFEASPDCREYTTCTTSCLSQFFNFFIAT